MLKYTHKPSGKIKVLLDGRVVGEIRKVNGGYQYFPKGQKVGGEVFQSWGQVQRSLSGT